LTTGFLQKYVAEDASMKSPKKISCFILCVLLAGVISGCAEQRHRLALGSAASTGATYSICGSIANAVCEYSDKVHLTSEVSGGTAENIRNLKDGTIEFGIINTDNAYYFWASLGTYKNAGSNKLRGVWSMFPYVMHVVTPAGSDIKSIGDLRGKRIALGTPGSGYESFARTVLAAYSMTYDDVEEMLISPTQMVDALKDGQVDAFFLPINVPVGSITDLTMSMDISLLSIDELHMENLQKINKAFIPYAIPPNTYKNQTERVIAPSQKGMIVAFADKVSDEDVYEVVKNMWEHREAWEHAHSTCAEMTIETTLAGMPIPLHNGAYKYYKEKGLRISPELVPPEAHIATGRP
jgi:TRAP transporter TAXI family solute receptor